MLHRSTPRSFSTLLKHRPSRAFPGVDMVTIQCPGSDYRWCHSVSFALIGRSGKSACRLITCHVCTLSVTPSSLCVNVLSGPKHGFESRWGRHPYPGKTLHVEHHPDLPPPPSTGPFTTRTGRTPHRPQRATGLTQIERTLGQLRIELVPASSPQAWSRMERLWVTWQGWLSQELRLASCTRLQAANAFLSETEVPFHNRTWTSPRGRGGDCPRPLRRRAELAGERGDR